MCARQERADEEKAREGPIGNPLAILSRAPEAAEAPRHTGTDRHFQSQ